MGPEDLTARLKAEARRLGFDLAGATAAVVPPRLGAFRQWLADGFAGEMQYIPRRAAAYEHPKHVLDGASSLLMLAIAYRTEDPVEPAAGQGRIARYAWGTDYHDLVRKRLHALADFHRELTPVAAVRGVVDTAPLLEREFAALAGLGWVGKNTLLLNRQLGSWFLLAALLTSETLVYDGPLTAGHCGTCRACIDACPTGAIVEPYRLDARKCISCLTIELGGPIPPQQREWIGPRIFGCDICQDVCPFNRRPSPTAEPAFWPRPNSNPVDLAELLRMDDAAFGERFRGSPVLRAERRGLLCQAAYALGNRPDRRAAPALVEGLRDADAAVCEACAWALARYGPTPILPASAPG
jgi:epoxyqueuosine reductase